MKRFICWYAYRGQETEGSLFLEEPQIYNGADKAEAMWKYYQYLFSKNGGGFNPTEKYKNVAEFREKYENITGWGFCCEELKS